VIFIVLRLFTVGFTVHEGIVAFTLWTNSISSESCQVTIHNWNSQWSQVSILYQNIEALCPHILVPFSCGTKSQLVSFSFWPEQLSISLCNLPGSCVLSDGTYRYWTGKWYLWVCSTLSWSAEFKHINISAHAVHIWGDWQHLKGHWVKGERQSRLGEKCETQWYSRSTLHNT
jgi:hypothetical protein